MKTNMLYRGDCLEIMRDWDDRSVDLIYLDPPFNSKANYNILFGAQRNGGDKNDLAQTTAFTDTWEWDEQAEHRVQLIMSTIAHPAHRAIRAFSEIYPDGSGMLSYLSYMAERIAAMRRLLKNTGSIYLHCDPTASHYLKIVMDEVFGKENFRNEIVWHYPSMSRAEKDFPRKHDNVLRYAKTNEWIFNSREILIPYAKSTIDRAKYGGAGFTKSAGKAGYLKRTGKVPDTVWKIPHIKSKKERTGYPTQKPLKLLERIIKASSNEGDVVLDPFCGSGTTLFVAKRLNRKWIGIDESRHAIKITEQRLCSTDPVFNIFDDPGTLSFT